MNGVDTLGWCAAGLMLLTFSCSDARHLRALALAANLAFIVYGALARLPPILTLHLLLLPVNACRLLGAVRQARGRHTEARIHTPRIRPGRTDEKRHRERALRG